VTRRLRGSTTGEQRSTTTPGDVLRCGAASLALVASGWLASACQWPTRAGPPLPFVEEGACPFAGCSYGRWTATGHVALKAEPHPDAPVVFRLRPGDHAEAVTGTVTTVRSGVVRFHEPVDLASADGPIHVSPDEPLFIVTDRGTTTTTAWWRGRFYRDVIGTAFSAPECARPTSACAGTIIEKPRQIWWVQVRNDRGELGWTNQTDRFDGGTRQTARER